MIIGEWLWCSDVYACGADRIFDNYQHAGVTDVYLLTKGTAGKVAFNAPSVALGRFYEDRDILQESIDAAHARGIRLHAWLTSSHDALYKQHHPEAGLYHIKEGRVRDIIRICDEPFTQYMEQLITQMTRAYDIDGLHLDYIRYNHMTNGWGPEDIAQYEAAGANMQRLYDLAERTFFTDGGDSASAFDAYNSGDQDAIAFAMVRRQNVRGFAKRMIAAALAVKPHLILSAALMPEGAYDKIGFSDMHYGQNYEEAAGLYHYVLPMAYSHSYAKDAAWVGALAKQTIAKGNQVVMGVQAFDPAISETLRDDITAVTTQMPLEGLLGYARFRTNAYAYAFAHAENGQLTVQLDNTLCKPMEYALLELQGGLTAVSTTIGDIQSDKKTVRLPALDLWQKHTVVIRCDGEMPQDPVLVRVFAEGEMSAYCQMD